MSRLHQLAGGFNNDLLVLANQKTTQLKQERLASQDRIDELKSIEDETDTVVNLAKSWRSADYKRKKAVAMIIYIRSLSARTAVQKYFGTYSKLPGAWESWRLTFSWRFSLKKNLVLPGVGKKTLV